ncbi:MAG TPA: DsbA family protein [Acidimicrobiales bacterium]|nr:DsbA family protein [Acidimicrobiales bacterium]
MHVSFFFDPGCPWCWITSRWLLEVAPHRSLDIEWRPFSLDHKNRAVERPDHVRCSFEATRRSLRVIEAARQRHGGAVVGDLYTRIGGLVHHDGDRELDGLAAAVTASGIDPDLLDAAVDEAWDAPILAAMAEVTELAGDDVGVPLMLVEDGAGRRAFFGPVFSPAPHGEAAVAAFDGLVALTAVPGFFELKRGRDVGPLLPDRVEA